jgi:hypothetical protein
MAVVELDDQQGCQPWHNQSAVKVRRGRVGGRHNVGDEGGGPIFCNSWNRHGYEWLVEDAGEQDAGGNDYGAEGAL